MQHHLHLVPLPSTISGIEMLTSSLNRRFRIHHHHHNMTKNQWTMNHDLQNENQMRARTSLMRTILSTTTTTTTKKSGLQLLRGKEKRKCPSVSSNLRNQQRAININNINNKTPTPTPTTPTTPTPTTPTTPTTTPTTTTATTTTRPT